MKRLFIIASLAILAVGCQKTEIQNEVQTPIGFSTEVGKQTRAIVDGADYGTTQPFAVYAYGHQTVTSEVVTKVMDNVEVSYQAPTWKPTVGSYYWPNDPRTTMNFYAFSPYIKRPATQEVAASADPTVDDVDKVMSVSSLSHTENEGLVFTGYTHSNMYVDFMAATSVIGATYAHSDGNPRGNETAGKVPITFNHMMTQILFKVTTDKVYDGITFTVESITLNNINNTADYNDGDWTPSGSASYTIFPAAAANGAAADEDEIALVSAQGQVTTMTTIGVTMIPQELVASVEADNSGAGAVAGQSFTIVYRIAGTGVASETVSKTVDLAVTGGVNEWNNNKKITYTVKIGLNEITFEPSVATWVDEPAANATDEEKEKYEYTFQQ